ncbi:hypothetical protein HH800_18685 [Sphingobium yanoikuyae]|uniref:Uncharacterized protein n=1 Tax=Sphingobium yanoikuyae TaxID=13690 RepID=A0A3G2V213_SPHYA|nr:hypothetical protein EBF16_18785 [Sphingobium yanoikuyae]QJR05495.1 hypothetical protein HH800_18685 [Sphingobium yanoikuyae]
MDRTSSRKDIEAIGDCKPAHDAGFVTLDGEIFHASSDELRRPSAILTIHGQRFGPAFHLPRHRNDGVSTTTDFFFTHNSLVRVISINASGKQRS